jgi:multicomponent Na+:H+ antiporter subunit G
MAIIRDILAIIAFATGVMFTIGGLAGLFRFPDAYSRLQAGSLAGTTGVISFFIGALLLSTNLAMALRVLIIIVFFLLSSPTGGHLIARFTWNSGVQPWRPKGLLRSGRHRNGRNSE